MSQNTPDQRGRVDPFFSSVLNGQVHGISFVFGSLAGNGGSVQSCFTHFLSFSFQMNWKESDLQTKPNFSSAFHRQNKQSTGICIFILHATLFTCHTSEPQMYIRNKWILVLHPDSLLLSFVSSFTSARSKYGSTAKETHIQSCKLKKKKCSLVWQLRILMLIQNKYA